VSRLDARIGCAIAAIGVDTMKHLFELPLSLVRLALALSAVWLATACTAAEPKNVSLSATTFNYSQDTLVFVWIGQKQAGVGVKKAEPGEVKGGGSFICCVSVQDQAKKIEVRVQTVESSEYTVVAPVIQPWPEIVNNIYIYVLPNRRVVAEAFPGPVWIDDAQARLAELEKFWELNK
jgi:hypothetical protein